MSGRCRRAWGAWLRSNPRKDNWSAHFRLDGAIIEPLTAEGEVTARILRLNLDKRVAERRLLIAAGRYSLPE